MCPGSTSNGLSVRHCRQSDPNQKRTASGAKNLGCNVRTGHTYSVYHCGIIMHCGIHQNHPASDDLSYLD